jgi:hypothetical protein
VWRDHISGQTGGNPVMPDLFRHPPGGKNGNLWGCGTVDPGTSPG